MTPAPTPLRQLLVLRLAHAPPQSFAAPAVISLTRMAALPLAPHDINANAICPGTTVTALSNDNLAMRAKAQGVSVEEMEKRRLALLVSVRAPVRSVRDLGYCCAFGSEVGPNAVGQDVFGLRRIDTKDVP